MQLYQLRDKDGGTNMQSFADSANGCKRFF